MQEKWCPVLSHALSRKEGDSTEEGTGTDQPSFNPETSLALLLRK
jgi:hypothetical protein